MIEFLIDSFVGFDMAIVFLSGKAIALSLGAIWFTCIENRITPLTESFTELETYTQNQFKAVREELKKPLAIAR